MVFRLSSLQARQSFFRHKAPLFCLTASAQLCYWKHGSLFLECVVERTVRMQGTSVMSLTFNKEKTSGSKAGIQYNYCARRVRGNIPSSSPSRKRKQPLPKNSSQYITTRRSKQMAKIWERKTGRM